MRFLYARLKGYIGIYNGLGLNELAIDFANSSHRIIVISGINGCGKSTLMNALNVLPDNSTSYTPEVSAEKELIIQDGNVQYHILITSPITKSGRGPTKASIRKNGEELNPNGNISSYKEIIFSEFDLDSNFLTLSQLSSSDRGLADKLPSERKRFMSSIIDTLEVYNDIYKTLNKKATIFKSYINNLHTKIQNIGDEESLRTTLSMFIRKRDQIKLEIDQIKDLISKTQAKIEMSDPQGNIHDRYLDAEKVVESSKKIKTRVFTEFERNCAKLNLPPDIENLSKILQEQKEIEASSQTRLTLELESKKTSILARKSELSLDIDSKRLRLEKLSEGVDYQLEYRLKTIREQTSHIEAHLSRLGIDDPLNVSRDELLLIKDTVFHILNLVDSYYMDTSDEIIRLSQDTELENRYASVTKKFEEVSISLNLMKEEKIQLLTDAKTLSILDNRPGDCIIHSCPFIAEAYHLKEQKYPTQDISKQIAQNDREITRLENEKEILDHELGILIIAMGKRNILLAIQDHLTRNQNILSKNRLTYKLLHEWTKLIQDGNQFNEYRDLQIFQDAADLINEYKTIKSDLIVLEADWKIQSNNMEAIQLLKKEIEDITILLENSDTSLIQIGEEINSVNGILQVVRRKITDIEIAVESGHRYIEAETEYQKAELDFNRVKEISQASINAFQQLSHYTSQLEIYSNEYRAIEPKISTIHGQLNMLEEYKKEFKVYSDKYNMVDLIRRYTSPSKGGIQSLFIQVYMSKTLDLANQILQMIFNGEYRLLDFVITGNEFRIPFIGSGLMVDDVSSGSTSQICIIGMVINLVLLNQASTRFNITRLDEIDGGLDSRNKADFIAILYRVIEILNIEQLFIISHSAELELSNVDIIRLRSYEDYDATSFRGNVIYDYNTINQV